MEYHGFQTILIRDKVKERLDIVKRKIINENQLNHFSYADAIDFLIDKYEGK